MAPKASSSSVVSFQEVTVYEFPVRIGDNPACSTGCPITMASKHKNVIKQRLDSADTDSDSDSDTPSRSDNNNDKRRSSKELHIPADVRTKLLLQHGYELEKIVKRTEDVLKIQEQRRESMNKTFGEGVKDFFGPATKGFKSIANVKINRTSAKSA